MRRTTIAVCLAAGVIAVMAGPAGAATLSPNSANFGTEPIGGVSATKSFTVTAGVPDDVLPMTIATTGDFKQTNDCPSSIRFLLTRSCTIKVSFAPTSVGTRSGTLSTTTLVVGGPSASLLGTATQAAQTTAGKAGTAAKCKKKGKNHKKGKKGKKRAAAAKKHGKKHKKHKGCKKKKHKKHRKGKKK
jgi:hypothetical protein